VPTAPAENKRLGAEEQLREAGGVCLSLLAEEGCFATSEVTAGEDTDHTRERKVTGDVIRGSQLGLPDTDADGFATWHPANQSASSGALTSR
jgi:hypothetical protein